MHKEIDCILEILRALYQLREEGGDPLPVLQSLFLKGMSMVTPDTRDKLIDDITYLRQILGDIIFEDDEDFSSFCREKIER